MAVQSYPLRGEVYWINLDPTQGSEIQKTRPCLVLTNNVLNRLRRTVVVIPLSNTAPLKFPLHVALPSLGETTQAVMDQVRAIDKGRFGRRLGVVTSAEMNQIEEAVRIIFDVE